MRIACSRCEARYDLPEERLERGPVKIRCSRCGHVFAVRLRAEAAEAAAASVPPDARPFGDRDEAAAAGAAEPPEPAPAETKASASFDDFDFGSFDEPAAPPPPAEPASLTGASASFEDFDFDAFEKPAAPTPDEPKAAAGPQDFDFGTFEAPAPQSAPAAPTSSLFDDELPPLGELDLGEFEEPGGGLGLDEEERGPVGFSTREPDRVRREELVSSAPARDLPVQGLTEETPRLDLQKGPRREAPAGKPSRVVASDRRRSPLTWIVALVAVGTVSFTGYNLYRRPEALTFLNPSRIRALWADREVEAKFAVEDVKGYPQNLPGGRRVFVVRGAVVNRSSAPQGLLRVRANLFGAGGVKLASSEVYCGNLLTERELATLPRAAVEARLQNQVGKNLSNVDIAPGNRVPFMVVFLSPPAGVDAVNVQVTSPRPGSGA